MEDEMFGTCDDSGEDSFDPYAAPPTVTTSLPSPSPAPPSPSPAPPRSRVHVLRANAHRRRHAGQRNSVSDRVVDSLVSAPHLDAVIVSTYARRDSARRAAAAPAALPATTPALRADPDADGAGEATRLAGSRTDGWKAGLIRYQAPPSRPPIQAGLGDALNRAASAARDARAGRATSQDDQPWKFAAYELHYSAWFFPLLFLASAVQHAEVAWEPASHRSDLPSPGSGPWLAVVLVDLAVLAVFSLDAVLTAVHHGPLRFWRKPWRAVSGVCVVAFWIDLVAFAAGAPLRFSRVLRPVYLVSRWRRVRTTLRAVLRTAGPLVPVMGKLVVAEFVYGLMGVALFRSSFSTGTPYEHFDNIGSALLILFVVLTGQGLPAYWYVGAELTPLAAPYFVSYLFFTGYLLSTEMIAVLMRFYKWHRKRSVVYDRWKERSSLASAFLALSRPPTHADPDSAIVAEYLSWSSASALIGLLSPSLPASTIRTLFKSLTSEAEPEAIDMSAFFVFMDTLFLRYSPPSSALRFFTALPSVPALADVVTTRTYAWAFRIVLLAFAGLCASVTGSTIPAPASEVGIAVGVALGLLWVDVVLRALAYGPAFWVDKWARFSLAAMLVSSVAYGVHASGTVAAGGRSEGTVWALVTVAAIRLLTLSAKVRHHVETLVMVMPSLGPSFVLIAALVYMYAVVGLEAFATKLSASRANFDSFGVASRTVFQVATGASWQQVMYAAMAATHPAAALYFITAVMLFVLFFARLVSALLLQIFTLVADLRQAEGETTTASTSSANGLAMPSMDAPELHRTQSKRRMSVALVDVSDIEARAVDEEVLAKRRASAAPSPLSDAAADSLNRRKRSRRPPSVLDVLDAVGEVDVASDDSSAAAAKSELVALDVSSASSASSASAGTASSSSGSSSGSTSASGGGST